MESKETWEWYLQFAEREKAAANIPEQGGGLPRRERELDDFRAALRACHEAADGHGDRVAAEVGLRLATALDWLSCGYLAEGLDALETALADGADLPAALRAPALGRAGYGAAFPGYGARGQVLLSQSRLAYETLLQEVRRKGQRQEIGTTVLSLMNTCDWSHDLEATWTYGQEARQRMEELGDAVGLMRALEAMAGVALARGEPATARPLLEEQLKICRRLGTSGLLMHALGSMGHVGRDEGNYERARAYYQESLVVRRDVGDKFTLAQALEDLAVLAATQGQAGYPREAWVRTTRLLGAAEALCDTLGVPPPVAAGPRYQAMVAAGRAVLGEAAFAAAWAEGRAMSLDEAVEYALGEEREEGE